MWLSRGTRWGCAKTLIRAQKLSATTLWSSTTLPPAFESICRTVDASSGVHFKSSENLSAMSTPGVESEVNHMPDIVSKFIDAGRACANVDGAEKFAWAVLKAWSAPDLEDLAEVTTFSELDNMRQQHTDLGPGFLRYVQKHNGITFKDGNLNVFGTKLPAQVPGGDKTKKYCKGLRSLGEQLGEDALAKFVVERAQFSSFCDLPFFKARSNSNFTLAARMVRNALLCHC